MANSAADRALISTIATEIARAKSLPDAELAALGETGTSFQVVVAGKSYDINTWSEPVAGDSSGTFVVLVGAWRKLWFGFAKHHFRGFIVLPNSSRADIPESDLWQYD